jgi:hypothetical protein
MITQLQVSRLSDHELGQLALWVEAEQSAREESDDYFNDPMYPRDIPEDARESMAIAANRRRP